MTAREFFESAREASRDAERIRNQLRQMEARMHSLGGSQLDGSVSSTPEHDKMARRVASYVDRERALERRQEEDYDLIDRACVVLYGNGDVQGLDVAQSAIWADVLWWRYLDDATWGAVARAVGYSIKTCRAMCEQALRWIDESEFCSSLLSVEVWNVERECQ